MQDFVGSFLSMILSEALIMGIVIGTAAGVMTVVITGLWGRYVRSRQRREQTVYLRDLVMEGIFDPNHAMTRTSKRNASVWSAQCQK